MKKNKQLLLIIFTMVVLLISACGERTTVYEELAEEGEKSAFEIEGLSLEIIAFAFDSANADSPVTVRWEAVGDFGEGFMIAWSPDNPAPMPGEHGWVPVTDDTTREIQVKLTQKVPHYFRICRVKDGVCDVFSETIQVIFPEEALGFVDEQEQHNDEEPKVTKTIKATPTKGETPTPKKTDETDAAIKITEITTDEDGIVTVAWDLLSGSAPLGFHVNWSNKNSDPTPDDEGIWVKDENARSLDIEGFGRGYKYYFRVCVATEEGCGSYSPSVTYKVPKEATKTPTAYVTPTLGASEDSITITSLVESGDGQVKIDWTADGYFPKGFKIVWSKSSSAPVFPGDSYAYVSDPAKRSAYVKNLVEGNTYYFRVCRYTGSTCDLYSNTQSITMSSGGEEEESTIVLESINDAGIGAAKLVWSATGSFPNGFKIAYSSHNTSPVFPGDSYEYVSNSSSRSVIVDNLTEGETYYFRVCKYEGGGCTVYSNMKSYDVPVVSETKTPSPTKTPAPSPTPDGSTISLDSIVDGGCGVVTVNWTAVGSFPSGFKVVWSDVNTAPTFPGNDYYYDSSPSASSAYLSGYTVDTTYYFRVCRYNGSSCDLYSNMMSFDMTCPTPTPTPEP